MTHKNPELRAGSVVKAKESSPKPKSTPTYGKTVAADKPSRFELDGGFNITWCSSCKIIFTPGKIIWRNTRNKLYLPGKKWVVEYMKDNPSVNISDAQPNQVV